MAKPRMLYRYDLNKTLMKHKINFNCMPLVQEGGVNLHRCNHGSDFPHHDFYGYPTLNEAVKEEIAETQSRIWDDQFWLGQLKKRIKNA